jgi:hypothetical protein
VLCYNNTTDDGKKRRYLGVIRLYDNSGTPNFVDNTRRRFIANNYNQQRTYLTILDTTTHDYDTGAFRAWNNDTSLTLMEWIGLQAINISVDTRFYYDPNVAGDRAQVRLNTNGAGSVALIVEAAGTNPIATAGPAYISQRLGYNSSYVEEYGFTNDLIYSQINAHIEVWV